MVHPSATLGGVFPSRREGFAFMPLKIRYTNGAYAGRDIDIEDDKDEVRFGRGLDADIPFPEDLTLVSHQHFGLRKEYGGYKFIINQEKPVFLDGKPVFDGQDLPRSAEVQLSGPTGPRLKIERIDIYGSNQLKTEVLQRADNVADAVHDTRSKTRMTAGSIVAVALALLVAAGAGYWALRGTQDQVVATNEAVQQTQAAVAETRSQVDALREEVPSLKQQMDSIAKSFDFTTLIAEVKGSVYQVAIQLPSGTLRAGGTAWVVQLADGTKALATNAHVAEIFDDIKGAGVEKLVVVEPKGPDFKRFTVRSIKKHPAYDAWMEFANAYYAKNAAGTVRNLSLPIGYDVALLYVDNQQALGAPLKLADATSLEAMAAGDRLLQIGYPVENVTGNDLDQPEPTSNSGTITSMTSFFLAAGSAVDRQFIQHTAAGAGGSSGSAMFNTKGEVVGLHNSGNYIFIPTGPGENDYERVPSAGGINYAQRVDLLSELIQGRAEDRLEKVYRPMWAAAEKTFSKTPEAIVQDQVAMLATQVGGMQNVRVYQTFEGEMKDFDPILEGFRGVVFDVDPPVGKAYLFMATSDDQRNIGLAIFRKDDNSLFTVGTRGSFFSSYTVVYDSPMPTRLAVFDDFGGEAQGDTRPPGKIKVTIYEATLPADPGAGG